MLITGKAMMRLWKYCGAIMNSRILRIKVCRYGFGSSDWEWCIINNRNTEIAGSCRTYGSRKSAVRAARYYAKKFSCIFFVVKEQNEAKA